jgi:hypothetical protein
LTAAMIPSTQTISSSSAVALSKVWMKSSRYRRKQQPHLPCPPLATLSALNWKRKRLFLPQPNLRRRPSSPLQLPKIFWSSASSGKSWAVCPPFAASQPYRTGFRAYPDYRSQFGNQTATKTLSNPRLQARRRTSCPQGHSRTSPCPWHWRPWTPHHRGKHLEKHHV